MDKTKCPCLSKLWKIVCNEYDIPQDTPLPDLPKLSDKEIEIAEFHAQTLTMGDISKWLRAESFRVNSTLLDAMNDMWMEADNV